MNSVLVSVGAALPKKCVLNSELPAHLDTSGNSSALYSG